MSWMKMLCDTFDENSHLVANFEEKNFICPISYITANAQIEIVINSKGEFSIAREITDREDASIIIPATEESASRSSGIAPHPLCDSLSYIAGDYFKYASTEKESKIGQERFEKYLEALDNWASSEMSHEKVNAIFEYVKKKNVIKNLIDSGIIKVQDNGKFSKDKIAGTSYDKCLVRFKVEDAYNVQECWLDDDLVKCYQKYYLSTREGKNRKDICYLTGEKKIISDNHPKGILPASYGAKLISANSEDANDFVYRGRFKTGSEAYAVSYEVTQKAHNMLRWLAKNQGYIVGAKDKRTYICWNPKGKPVIPIKQSFYLDEDGDDNAPTTMPEYKKKLALYINGYKNNFDEDDEIALMVLEAATTGRLSIVYYNELNARDFFKRVEKWREECCWEFSLEVGKGDQKKKWNEIITPSINTIVKYSFGTRQDEEVKIRDKLAIKQYHRVFRCVVDGQQIPIDFVNSVFKKASNLAGYKKKDVECILSTACAIMRKYYGGEFVKMELDRTFENRDYLYGRLLAVYEKIERSTYRNDENREPNAIRYQLAFAQHPARTSRILLEKMNPYLRSIKPGLRESYRREMEEIVNMIGIEDVDKALGHLYIVGYWAERKALRTKKGKTEEE